jgi:hypothetical protein
VYFSDASDIFPFSFISNDGQKLGLDKLEEAILLVAETQNLRADRCVCVWMCVCVYVCVGVSVCVCTNLISLSGI